MVVAKNKELHIDGKVVAKFELEIAAAFDFGDCIALLLKTESDPRNVIAVDREGRTLWRIKELKTPYGILPYSEMRAGDGTVWLANVDECLIVEARTGKVLKQYFGK